MHRTATRALSIVVLFAAVLPNTLTAGHWNFLVCHAREPYTYSVATASQHYHLGHDLTPAPSAPQLESLEDTLTGSLAGAALWELPPGQMSLAAGERAGPPSPPPRSV